MRNIWNYLGITLFWLLLPGLRIYLKHTTRTRVLVVVDKEVLLVKTWLGDGRWILPGGGLHKEEKASNGALREVLEETGMQLPQGRLIFLADRLFNHNNLTFMASYFVVKLDRKPAVHAQRFEISDYAWVQCADIVGSAYGQDVHEALRLYRRTQYNLAKANAVTLDSGQAV